MTEGINANGEKSIYSYNGLGALMENTWVIAKNGYGCHYVNADDAVQAQTSNKDKPTGNNAKKTSTVKKQFVVDFTSDTYRLLQEHEINGLFTYGLSVSAGAGVVPAEIHANAFSGNKIVKPFKLKWLYNKIYGAAKFIYNKLKCNVQKKVKNFSGKFFTY